MNDSLKIFISECASFPSLSVLALGVLITLIFQRKKFIVLTVFVALIAEMFSFREALQFSVFKETLFSGTILNSFSTRFVSLLFLLLSFLIFSSKSENEISEPHEYGVLYLVSLMGGVVLVKAQELLTFFVALECLSLPLYCMCGASLAKRESAESALKYFMLGAFSSAFFLFGVSLLYGATGSTSIPEIYDFMQRESTSVGLIGSSLVIFSLLFKAGAAPFHFWVTDVYSGATKTTTTFMASAVKVVTLGVCARICGEVLVGAETTKILWCASLLSIIIGNLLALHARTLVALLAASSIAHVGYLLVSILGGMVYPHFFFYLTGYVLSSLGAFTVISTLSSPHLGASQNLKGLYKNSPLTGLLLSLFLFSFAGLPPVMSGLYGKFLVFSLGISSGFTGLVIIALLASAVSLAYYLRLISDIFFQEGEVRGECQIAVLVSALGIIIMSVCPDALLSFFQMF